MNWFKFYGQEFLTDPKIMELDAVSRALWVTILCLASQNDGVIKHIDEWKIMVLTGISPLDDEWQEAPGFLKIFENLGMVTISDETVTVTNYEKRQSTNLSGAERQKRFRERQKEIEAKTESNVTQRYDSNGREDKIRIDKNRIERDVASSQKYLLEIPEIDIEVFTDKFTCTRGQVIAKGVTLINYCKAKGKTYKDYRAFLRNALEKDFGIRSKSTNAVDYVKQKEAEIEREGNLTFTVSPDAYKKIGKPMS